MNLLRMLRLVGFLGLMHLAAVPAVQADAITQPRFTLTDLGPASDGQANPYYSPPTGYKIQEFFSSDPLEHGLLIGLAFSKEGSTDDLLPDYISNSPESYILWGYSSSGVVYGYDVRVPGNTSSFYYDTNSKEFGNFKDSGVLSLGVSGINSLGQALGSKSIDHGNSTSSNYATYYSSFLSDPVLLKDLVTKDLGKWVLHAGASINDDGQIFGEMMNLDTYESRYYRLDPVPVPEPSTIIVFTAGSLLYLVRNKLRKKS